MEKQDFPSLSSDEEDDTHSFQPMFFNEEIMKGQLNPHHRKKVFVSVLQQEQKTFYQLVAPHLENLISLGNEAVGQAGQVMKEKGISWLKYLGKVIKKSYKKLKKYLMESRTTKVKTVLVRPHGNQFNDKMVDQMTEILIVDSIIPLQEFKNGRFEIITKANQSTLNFLNKNTVRVSKEESLAPSEITNAFIIDEYEALDYMHSLDEEYLQQLEVYQDPASGLLRIPLTQKDAGHFKEESRGYTIPVSVLQSEDKYEQTCKKMIEQKQQRNKQMGSKTVGKVQKQQKKNKKKQILLC